MTPRTLRGAGVLVTRPEHQASPLVSLIQSHAGEAVRFPTMQIVPIDVLPAILMARINAADIITFISANAVYCTQRLLTENSWVSAKQIAAVGQRTALALQQAGWRVDIFPQIQFDSEALLACSAMQDVKAKRVLIIRGQGGREMLAASLRERGAEVDYAEVYRREIPDADAASLLQKWRAGKIHVTTLTSNSALQGLVSILGDMAKDFLQHMPLAVFSRRQAQLARQLGCEAKIVIATQPSDEAMLEAVYQALQTDDQVLH